MGLQGLLTPVRTVKKLKSRLATHLHILTFGRHGQRRFRGDIRYNLQNVTEGFRSKIDAGDDTSILERICDSYRAATEDQKRTQNNALLTDWANVSLDPRLGTFSKALLAKDLAGLARMCKNFYRDACSSGLLAPPGGLAKAYFSGPIGDMYRHFYMGHVLYRLDYWETLTNSKYAIRTLAGPGIGNPFGVVLDGAHVAVGAEHSHYCAQRVIEQLSSDKATVAEVRGGFGAIAYYVLRDRPGARYIDIDIPEYLALASYYLMKAFPHLRFLCYGEKPVTQKSIDEADIVFVPRHALKDLPSGSVDMTYSVFGLSNLPPEATNQCLGGISRITNNLLFLIHNKDKAEYIQNVMQAQHRGFHLVDTRQTGWHSHKVSGAGVGGAANRDASMILEHSYMQKG